MKFLTAYSNLSVYCCKQPSRHCGVHAVIKGTKVLTLKPYTKRALFFWRILQKLIFAMEYIKCFQNSCSQWNILWCLTCFSKFNSFKLHRIILKSTYISSKVPLWALRSNSYTCTTKRMQSLTLKVPIMQKN